MLLALDIGNTNVKVGLWDAGAWRLSRRAHTLPDKTADEYAVLLRDFLLNAGLDLRAVTGAVISSVVPPLTPVFVDMVRRYIEREPLVVTSRTPTGLRLELDYPEQTGTDRIVNAAAAAALYGSPAIAVDFGTATKFDVVMRGDTYRGGAISPGIRVALDALVGRAALLQPVDIAPPPNPIGRNTVHAIQSGVFWGYVALADSLLTRIKDAMDDSEVRVIATGGLAALVSPHITGIDVIAPDLTLDGLRVIYDLNGRRSN